jgi:hypothetical protein
VSATSDCEAFEHYDDPANREPAAGEARRRGARKLERHVAVRFPAETVESVRPLAQSDGMTVSAWIRRAVDSAIRRQQRE